MLKVFGAFGVAIFVYVMLSAFALGIHQNQFNTADAFGLTGGAWFTALFLLIGLSSFMIAVSLPLSHDEYLSHMEVTVTGSENFASGRSRPVYTSGFQKGLSFIFVAQSVAALVVRYYTGASYQDHAYMQMIAESPPMDWFRSFMTLSAVAIEAFFDLIAYLWGLLS